jgi:hypothetical protein
LTAFVAFGAVPSFASAMRCHFLTS